jgi:hypothetical protein
VQRATDGAAPATKAPAPQATAPGRIVSPFSLTGVQRRVKVGAPGDSAEHEANRVADQVSSGSSNAQPTISRLQLIQRKTAEPQMEGADASVQRAEASENKPDSSPATVQRAQTDDKSADASVHRAEASENKPDSSPAAVQRAQTDDKSADTSVHRAEASENKPDSSPATVQMAPTQDATSDTTMQRCCSCCTEHMERPSGTASVYCKFHSESGSDESVSRKAAVDLDAAASHAIAAKDSGEALRPDVRQKLESRMGADFSGVRVHEGPAAHEAAAALNARAFTHKGDIWLGRGESQDNTNLVAHEATHVVQQGAAAPRSANAPKHDEDEQPVVRRNVWDKITGVAGAVWDATGGRVVDAAGKVISAGADIFWRVVKEVAPAWIIDVIQEIRQKGIVGYLHDKVSAAFDSIFGGLSSGDGFIPKLTTTYAKLLKTAHEVITALGHGDCKPLFDAITKLGDILSEMAGEAWEKIKDFFAPIGDFFSNLWKKFGAPVVDFLTEVAVEQWNEIKALGQKIWDGTKPIRDTAAAAWKWLKDELGIGEGPEGQNGLLQWVQGKLGEAWDWFKDKLQPVIGPMKSLIDKIKTILPLDEILNLRKTVHEWLHHASQMATSMRKPKGVTENQDALRSQILPAVKKAIVSLRDKIVSAGTWVSGQIGGIAQTVTGFFASLRSNEILGRLSGAIQWVQDKITSLSDWVQSGVMGLFNLIGNGVAKLADFIEPVLNVLKKIVSVITNVVKELPGLIPIWNVLPACIRDPIKDFIIDNILSAIPIISTFLKIPEIWSKIQNLVMDFLTKVFVTGDLGGAVIMVIRYVLEAAGVNVDLMLRVLAKAADSLDDIIMHPVEFLRHLGDAVVLGMKQFVSNIWTHLAVGLVNWLVIPLRDLGVKPIKDLSLESIMGLVLEVLGISETKLRAKAEKAIGAKAVRVLEEAWKWIKALMRDGIGGIWKEIKSRMTSLWSTVIGGITKWITTDLVEAGIAKLAKMFAPVGAVIEAIQTIYKGITFLVNKINQILEMVDAVLNSIQNLIAGNIASAANWIENAIARTIPAVLAFFAEWIGVDPAPKVHEIVLQIQTTVEAALDWLVDKAIEIGKKIAGFAKKIAGKIAGLIFPRREFTVGSEEHTIDAKKSGDDYEILIYSKSMTIEQFIELANKEAPAEAEPGKLQAAYEAYKGVKVESPTENDDEARQKELEKQGKVKIEKFNAVADLIARIYPMIPSLGQKFETKIVFGPTDDRGGSMMTAHPLASDNLGKGSAPSQADNFPPIWAEIIKKREGKRLYIKGHLLNNKLGGSGTALENITPLTYSANGLHFARVESQLQDIVTEDSKRMVHYEVHVNYPSSASVPEGVSPAEGRLATSLTTNWYELVPENGQLTQKGGPQTATIVNVPPFPHAEASENKPDSSPATVQMAPTQDATSDTTVQRCCSCSTEHMERPSGTASVYCKLHGESGSDESVSRKAAGDLDAAASHAIATKDSGEALRPDVRQKLESRMSADFSGVRIHEGPAAHEAAAALNARAFTHKGDIWLGRGESQDNTNLVAHEATHVVQQGAAASVSSTVPRKELSITPANSAGGSTASISTDAAVLSAKKTSSPAPAAKVAGSASAGKAASEKSEAASHAASAENTAAVESSLPAVDQKPGAKSPTSDPAFLTVLGHIKELAARQKKPDAPVSSKVNAAHAAVDSKNEIPGRAAERKADDIHKVVDDQQKQQPFNREDFVNKLFDKINVAAPKSLGDVADFDKNNNLDSVKQDLNSGVRQGKAESQGQLPNELSKYPPSTEGIDRQTPLKLKPPNIGAVPQITAAGAAPKAATDEETSLQAGPSEIEHLMADSNVTEEQLQNSNEPDFQGALEEKKDVEQEAAAAPPVYRAQESALLRSAQNESQQLATKHVLGMHDIRKNRFGEVIDHQTSAQTEEEKQRDQIYGTVEGLYTSTKIGVEARLKKLDTDVNRMFNVIAEVHQSTFQEDVEADVAAYKEKRYSGLLRGKYHWWRDKFKGMPPEVNDFYKKRLKEYQDNMRNLLNKIADVIVIGLTDAQNLITAGKKAIDVFVASLQPQWQATGKKAARGIQQNFDSLEKTITDKEVELIDSLAKKYNDNLQQMNARIEEMKEEDKGLVDKATGAIKGVIQTISNLKDLLLDVLSRAADAIGLIIAHPIRFLEHLVDAGKLGFSNFIKNLPRHLIEGVMTWLFGAVGNAGIELPKNFDISGIVGLVLQVLGLTKANIRSRAVDILGEKTVHALETGAEVFMTLINGGPEGLWDYITKGAGVMEFIKGEINNLVSKAFDNIKTYVFETVIKAGIEFILELLTPVSAFIKACKAIYKIIMFFVEHGKQIIDLLNAIIDSIVDIAGGNISKAAAAVENTLVKTIPVIIGFLAGLLDIDGIADAAKKIIDDIRAPINKAIDWVINKAASLGRGIVGGAKKVAGKVAGFFFPKKKFTADSEEHTVEATEFGDDYPIVIHSKEMTVDEFIAAVHKDAPSEEKGLKEAFRLYKNQKVDSKKAAEAEREKELAQKGKAKVEKFKVVADLVAKIYPTIPSLAGGKFETKIIYGPTDDRGGSMMTAHPLAPDNLGKGSAPSQVEKFPPIWAEITKKREATRLYVKGHLLNNQLGGSGTRLDNITPLTYTANGDHLRQVERPIKETVTKASKKMVHYEVHVNYPSSAKAVPEGVSEAEGRLATSLTANWYELVPQGSDLVQKGSSQTATITNVPPYPHT